MIKNKKLGLALSGGGYRAAGFHIGTLKKLNEMNLLDKLDKLSTISGGSIIGAAYCLHEGNFEEFEEKMIETLSQKSVIKYVITSWRFLVVFIPILLLLLLSIFLPFTIWSSYTIVAFLVVVVVIVKYQFRVLPISEIIERAYDSYFFQNKTLSQLCEVPEIAINATNLQTVRHFTFSKRKMEDTAYAYFNPPVLFNNLHFPISKAVMASSCVPFAFSPISIERKYYKDLEDYGKVEPKLIDGGVYDNQGGHKLMQKNSSYSCDIIIVSDAGNKMPFQKAYNNTFNLLLRTVEVFMMRIKNFQMVQNIYSNHHEKEVAYLSLGWDLDQSISGFYNNLVHKNIRMEILSLHELEENWILNPQNYREEIIDHLKCRLKFDQLNDSSLPPERLQKIRDIGTNLTPIKIELLKDMIIHSSIMTEVQVKLYCPSLFHFVSN